MQDHQLVDLLTNWVSKRSSIFTRTRVQEDNPRSEFMQELKGHTLRLEVLLPLMNDDQLSALSELSTNLLAERRLRVLAFKK